MPRLHLRLHRGFALTVAIAALGCATDEPKAKPAPVDPKVMEKSKKDFGASLQETRKSALKVKDLAALTITALDRVVDPKQAELKSSFASFNEALTKLDAEAASMKRAAGTAHSDGQNFLSQWDQDLASLAHEDVSKEGKARHEEVHKAFTETCDELDKAVASVGELQKHLGDLKKYLDNALSAEGVEKASGVAGESRDGAHKAAEHIDAATEKIDHLVKELPR